MAVHNLAPQGVLFSYPTDRGVLFSHKKRLKTRAYPTKLNIMRFQTFWSKPVLTPGVLFWHPIFSKCSAAERFMSEALALELFFPREPSVILQTCMPYHIISYGLSHIVLRIFDCGTFCGNSLDQILQHI